MVEVLIIILATGVTAALSLTGGLIFLSKAKFARKIQKFGPLIAAAVLIWTVFGDIVPEILEGEDVDTVKMVFNMVSGFFMCMALNFVLGRFHKHGEEPGKRGASRGSRGAGVRSAGARSVSMARRAAVTMLITDTIHNVVDGVVIGLSFVAAMPVGLMTCLATVAHEIPQEIGDFAIMLKGGFSKKKIIRWQFLSGLSIVPAAVIVYIVGAIFADNEFAEKILGEILSFVAGALLYIAVFEVVIIVRFVKSRLPRQLKA